MSDMQTLRQQLSDSMRLLREGRMTVPVATAMSGVAQTLINSVKVEIEARKVAGNKQLPDYIKVAQPKLTAEVELTPEERELAEMELTELADLIPKPKLVGTNVTTHRMKDDK